MAVIDITNKLTTAKPVILFSEGEQYEVDDNKNTVLKAQALFNKKGSELDNTIEAIKLLLGAEAVEQITQNHPDVFERHSTITVVFIAIMAAVMGSTYEEAEARFRS